MKLCIYFTMFIFIVLSGCATNKSHENNDCKEKPVFKKIIVNIGADNIEIPEDKYIYYKDPLVNIARDSLINRIKDELDKDGKKLNIVKDQKCSEGAMLVDGQFISLVHKSRRFRANMNLKVINCSNNEVLLSEEFYARNKDRDFTDTPDELGKDAGKAVVRRLTSCDK